MSEFCCFKNFSLKILRCIFLRRFGVLPGEFPCSTTSSNKPRETVSINHAESFVGTRGGNRTASHEVLKRLDYVGVPGLRLKHHHGAPRRQGTLNRMARVPARLLEPGLWDDESRFPTLDVCPATWDSSSPPWRWGTVSTQCQAERRRGRALAYSLHFFTSSFIH